MLVTNIRYAVEDDTTINFISCNLVAISSTTKLQIDTCLAASTFRNDDISYNFQRMILWICLEVNQPIYLEMCSITPWSHLALLSQSSGGNTRGGQSSLGCFQGGTFLGSRPLKSNQSSRPTLSDSPHYHFRCFWYSLPSSRNLILILHPHFMIELNRIINVQIDIINHVTHFIG